MGEENLKETNKESERNGKDNKKELEKDEGVFVEEQNTEEAPLEEEQTTEEESFDDMDEIMEADEEEQIEKEGKMKQKIMISILGVVLFIIVAAYGGVSYYFSKHFFPNVRINGKDFAYQTVEEVEDYFSKQVQNYQLNVIGSKDIHDVIKGETIHLKFENPERIRSLMKSQQIWKWPSECLSKTKNELTLKLQYDQNLLEQTISKTNVATAEQIPSESARPEFQGEVYEIKPEVVGTKLDEKVLQEVISKSIDGLKEEVNLVEENCYIKPEFTSESQEVQTACDTLNKYIKTKVTYLMNEKEVVDKELISQWLTVDGKMNVMIKEGVVEEWFKKLGEKYDTVGKTRQYTAPSGKAVTVSGGTYGWNLNEKKEAELLKEYIKKGETVEREPEYYQAAASRSVQDFGNTYVDIDLSMQHMWYVVNGEVVLDTDIVTGTPTPKRITPEGVYSVVEKEENKTLIGAIVPETGKPEYKIPVRYWIRVTWDGIGIHDSTWRGSYGGSIFETDGSHGCINTPFNAVQSMYNSIAMGTPVVMHY